MNRRQLAAVAAALVVAFGLGMVTHGTGLWLGDGEDSAPGDVTITVDVTVTLPNVTVCTLDNWGGSYDPKCE